MVTSNTLISDFIRNDITILLGIRESIRNLSLISDRCITEVDDYQARDEDRIRYTIDTRKIFDIC